MKSYLAEDRLTHETGQTEQDLQARIAQLERELAESKRMAEELRAGEARFRSYFELPLAGRAILSSTKGWVQVNATLCELLGYTQTELMQMTWSELTHPDDRSADLVNFNRVITGKVNGFAVEQRFVRKDKRITYVDLAVQCVRRADGVVDYFVVLLDDITEHKRANQSLRESEQRYRLLFDEMLGGLVIFEAIFDPHQIGTPMDFRFVSVNAAFVRMTGLDSADILGKTLWQVMPGIESYWIERFRQVVTSRDPVQFESDIRELGRYFEVRAFKTEPGRFAATFNDITERKRAENQLRESEERFREAFDYLPIPIGLADNRGNILRYNQKFTECYGYRMEDVPTVDAWMLRAYPDPQYRRFVQNNWGKDFAMQLHGDAATALHQVRVVCQDGSPRQAEITARTLGSFSVSAFNDVTERNRAEESLRIKDHALESSINGIAISDLEGKLTYVNPAFMCLWGYSDPLQVLERNAIDFWQMQDQAAEVMAALHSRGGWIGELTAQRQDGSSFVAQVSASMVVNHTGDALAMLAAFVDITEHKRAERLIQARLELMDYAATHPLEEVLQKTLDQVGELTASPVGFYHFVDSDQKTLFLQAWSTRTLKEFCRAEGKGRHYPIDQAGVWVDCVYAQRPVIHNDYASLSHRKGLPKGHAPVIRELVAPILRAGKIVAILGVGNKATDYNDRDVELVQYFADVAWEVAERKRAEEALRGNG
ncbi:MAG: PAS domain S-box protein [Anaerolineae bacterium]